MTLCQIADILCTFLDDQFDDNITVSFALCVVFQWNFPCFMQYNGSVHRKEHGQNVGKAVTSVNRTADRRCVAKLSTHNVLHCITSSTIAVTIEPFVKLQLTQTAHTADFKGFLCLHDLVQTQSGQVDSSTDIFCHHFQPVHTADDDIVSFLIQFVGLLQRVDLHIFFDL